MKIQGYVKLLEIFLIYIIRLKREKEKNWSVVGVEPVFTVHLMPRINCRTMNRAEAEVLRGLFGEEDRALVGSYTIHQRNVGFGLRRNGTSWRLSTSVSIYLVLF